MGLITISGTMELEIHIREGVATVRKIITGSGRKIQAGISASEPMHIQAVRNQTV